MRLGVDSLVTHHLPPVSLAVLATCLELPVASDRPPVSTNPSFPTVDIDVDIGIDSNQNIEKIRS